VSGDRLTRASKVLDQLDGQTHLRSKSRYTVRQFSIPPNEKIAVHVTIRGPKAEKIFERDLKVKEHWLRRCNLSETGNSSFRIEEHIGLGAQYDPTIGIFGMDFYAVMGRSGSRVVKRKIKRARVGAKHRVTEKDELRLSLRIWSLCVPLLPRQARLTYFSILVYFPRNRRL
jgi:large subunit ribosomal protein L11e